MKDFLYGATFWQGLDDEYEPIVIHEIDPQPDSPTILNVGDIVKFDGVEKYIVARQPSQFERHLYMNYEVADLIREENKVVEVDG